MISKTPRSVAPTGFKSEPEKTLCSPIAPSEEIPRLTGSD
jgi:hypothetical protein